MAARPKNIVLCSDGTGNTTLKGRGSNVFKLYEALDLHGETPQIAFYDDGVGTQGLRPLKLLGGAFGWGLKRNVKELYTSLCRVYQPGDRIYLFGFSRGAYTVRTLGGLIIRCGILRVREDGRSLSEEELKRRVDAAHRAFRKHCKRFVKARELATDTVLKVKTVLPGGLEAELSRPPGEPADSDEDTPARRATDAFRRTYAVQDDDHAPDGKVDIQLIGVWDTVAAVGTPIRELTTALNEIYPFRFEDLTLSPRVKKACHALAIDDERFTFHPEMWDESQEPSGSDRIEQVWFAGVHSNVGGGYPQQGMSLVALDWMMSKAKAQGLEFHERYDGRMNVHDRLYDSRRGLAVYYRYRPRDIAGICEKHGVTPKIHVSALQRMAWNTGGYGPGNLPDSFEIVSYDLERPYESKAILDALRAHLENGGDGPSLLRRRPTLQKLVNRRRRLHGWLIALTAGLAALAVFGPWNWSDSLPGSLAGGLDSAAGAIPVPWPDLTRLVDQWPITLLILCGLLFLLIRSRSARRGIRSELSAFWRDRLPGPWDEAVYPSPPAKPVVP
jgi:uncharacterized protein (DUF2235 family)